MRPLLGRSKSRSPPTLPSETVRWRPPAQRSMFFKLIAGIRVRFEGLIARSAQPPLWTKMRASETCRVLPDVLWVVWRKSALPLRTAWKVGRMPRTCTICRHAKRHEIEDDLRAGLSYRDVARQYSISKDAVSRHRASHVSLHTTPALATAAKIIALLEQAETASMWNTTLVALKEVRRCAEELMKQQNYEIERGVLALQRRTLRANAHDEL
jgi:hypothetical protein